MPLLASLSRMAVGTLNAAGAGSRTTHTIAQEGSAHLSSVTGTPLSTRRLKIVTSCGSSTDKRVADMKRVRK